MHSYRISCLTRHICLGVVCFTLLFFQSVYSKDTSSLSLQDAMYLSIPEQNEQSSLYYSVSALPNPIGKISDIYLLDTKVNSLFTPLSKINYSFLSGGMWLRFSFEGKDISGQHLFLNLGSYVALPISVYRSISMDSKTTIEKIGTYESTRINLQTADTKQHAQYTYYVSIPTIPSPLFSPILENGNSSLANIVSIIQILCFGIILLAIIFSLLRAVLQKKGLFLLIPFFSSCILIPLIFGVPNTNQGFIQLSSLPIMLSSIFAVVIFPLFSLFAIVKNGEIIPKLQKNIVVGITLLVFCGIITPLIPTMAFLSRYFPFWPLLLLCSFPIALYTLQQGYTNAFLYLIACIAPTISLGITAIFSFLYIDTFFYVEVLPIIGLTISVCCVTLFSMPFTFMQGYKHSKPTSMPSEEEASPDWLHSMDMQEEADINAPEHIDTHDEHIIVEEEEYDIPSIVKERVVQAMNREPNIIPYSPRELFVYLYRALKRYSENYNVELSWFVDPDLDEDQEHDSDVIYNTLYSIGESLIINNPNSSVHISAKNITDANLPSHIRFSITITPEGRLHNFNSNSIADIAELIALAGGTLFMGNAQGKKMEMIITLPAVAKLINTTVTPKEQSAEYKPINKESEAIEHIIDKELDNYEATQDNRLLNDLEEAVEQVLPSTEHTIPSAPSPLHTTNIHEEQQESLYEEDMHSVDVHEEDSDNDTYSVEEEQQALEELRTELERLTHNHEARYEEEHATRPLESVTIIGVTDDIYEDIENDTEEEHALDMNTQEYPPADSSELVSPIIPPITKMPLPRVDAYGNEVTHTTPSISPIQQQIAEPVTTQDIVNEYLDVLNTQVIDSISSPEEQYTEESIDKNDIEYTEELSKTEIEDIFTDNKEHTIEDTIPSTYIPPQSKAHLESICAQEHRSELFIEDTTPQTDVEEELPTAIVTPCIPEHSQHQENKQIHNVSTDSNTHIIPAQSYDIIDITYASIPKAKPEYQSEPIDISGFLGDTESLPIECKTEDNTPQEIAATQAICTEATHEESPFLLTTEMVVHAIPEDIPPSVESIPNEITMYDTESFTASIRSSVQELLDARTEAEWKEIIPVFSDRSSVIIMDNDMNNRKLMLYFLEGLDYAIADVDSVQALLKQHAHYPAHLVVLDIDSIDMPITDIIGELHKIDRRYGEPPVMVVAVISNHSINIMNSGVVAVLNKPVNHAEFRALLLKLLPERVINSGRTAPQWNTEDDIAPMDFNKVTITPIVKDSVPEQSVHAKYASPAIVEMHAHIEEHINPIASINDMSSTEQSTAITSSLETITVSEQRILNAIQNEVISLPEYLYPSIPRFLSQLKQYMDIAETALRSKDYYKIIDISGKIALESKRFSLSSMEKIALCIERAATESDETAVGMLFEELANTMEVAVSLLVEIYERTDE